MTVAEVLVDTSVWIDHFRRGHEVLKDLLVRDAVLMHPHVSLELACDTLPAPRARTLSDLGCLRPARQAAPAELMDFIEREALYGQGCGLVDISLLAAARLTPGGRLWTLDRRLAALATRLGVSRTEPD